MMKKTKEEKKFEYYRHELDIVYPERSDEHMITVKHLRDTNFDENYQYLPKGAWHRFTRGVLRVLCYLLAFPILSGVKIAAGA